jgi:Zn-dependent protease with chaperone function
VHPVEQPAWAISGKIKPARVSILYNAGLAAVSCIMILLPIVYIGLIVVVAYAVCRHAIDPWYRIGSGTAGLLMYLAPLVVGTVFVFFMIKPLFARRAKERELQRITPEDEPELFRFVHAICDTVKAPYPAQVQLNLRVNASAGFQSGLLDMLRRRLTLTIGLPLAAGISIREFGGVLAHEFGHFSQGAAMSLNFIVRSVNGWFARVVYERDAWDKRLWSSARRSDFRIGILLHLARGAVWLARRILWLLMNVGHGVSCFMSRQMEFDADRFEIQVAGSETFTRTTMRFQLLNAAWQQTILQQSEACATNRLVADLPRLNAMAANRLPMGTRKRVEESLRHGKTGWFDTHPTDSDRVEASRALGAPGVLHGDGEATELFHDFDATAHAVTKRYYEEECGIDLEQMTLHPLERMATETLAAAEEDELVNEWFGPLVNLQTLGFFKLDRTTNDAALSEAGRSEILLELKPVIDSLAAADGRLIDANNASCLLEAGFTEEARQRAESEIAEARAKLEGPLNSICSSFGQFVREATESKPAGRDQLESLLDLAARFPEIADALVRLRRQTSALELLLVNAENASNTLLWNDAAKKLTESIDHDTAVVIAAFAGHEYPFAHARGKVLLTDFLCEWQEPSEKLGIIFGRGCTVVHRCLTLHYRVLGRLAALAQQVDSTARSEIVVEPVA